MEPMAIGLTRAGYSSTNSSTNRGADGYWAYAWRLQFAYETLLQTRDDHVIFSPLSTLGSNFGKSNNKQEHRMFRNLRLIGHSGPEIKLLIALE